MRPIKFIVAISFISFAALASIPVATGMIMEQFLTQRFDGDSGAVQILSYDRGLFSSRIEWKIRAEGFKALSGTGEILFLDRADHGFLSVKSRTSLEENPWFKDIMDQQPGKEPPMEMLTEYRVLGSVKSKISLKGFSWERAGRSVAILPGRVRVAMDRNGRVSGDLDWEGGRSQGRFLTGPLTMGWEMEKISGHAWESRITLALDHIRIEPGEAYSGPLELDNLAWELRSAPDPEKKFLSFGMNTDFQRLEWGFGLVREGTARISLNQVDMDGWDWVMGAYAKTLAGALNDMVWADPDMQARYQRLGEVAGDIGFRFLGQCERLLKKGLEIRVADLKARVDQEGELRDIRGDMTLSLKKNMTLAGFIPILLRPEAAFEIFDLKTSMTLPADMADQNPALVTPILQGMETGLFIRDKDVLSHRAEILDSRLILNQREVYFE